MSKVKCYQIHNWNEHYENSRSREVKDLQWVSIPNSHDGESYSRLMTMPNANTIFAAWILILQVASKCRPRGTLVRKDGKPHDSESLSIRTRAPRSWFQEAMPVLVQLLWVEEVICQSHEGADDLPSTPHLSAEERREGMERNKEAFKVPDLSPKKKVQVTMKPSLDQVKLEARLIGKSESSAEKFFNHYTAMGWMVGNSQIKDWTFKLKAWTDNTPVKGERPPSVKRPSLEEVEGRRND